MDNKNENVFDAGYHLKQSYIAFGASEMYGYGGDNSPAIVSALQSIAASLIKIEQHLDSMNTAASFDLVKK